MGLGKILRPRAVPDQQLRSTQITSTDTVTGATATYFIQDNIAPQWATASGYQGGMGIPGAWRAATLLSDLIGEMPWNAFRSFGDDEEEEIRPRPILLEQPSPPDTRMTTLSSGALDLIWHGNMFGIISARNFAGWPTALVMVPAINVAVRRVGNGDISPFPIGAVEYAIGELRFSSSDVLHVKGPCAPGELRGMGVLEAQWEALQLAKDVQKQAGRIANHGVPTGTLESDDEDMTDDEAAALKGKWMAQTAGGGVAVLNPNTRFTPLAWDPEKLQLVESRRMTLGEIELVFGLPVGWLGGMTSARQYSNIEQDAVNLIKFTLQGHVSRIEQAYSLLFPRGTNVHANLDFILRADTLSRYQAYGLATQNKPFMTVEEVRRKERLGPAPELENPPEPPIQAIASVGNALPAGPGNQPDPAQ